MKTVRGQIVVYWYKEVELKIIEYLLQDVTSLEFCCAEKRLEYGQIWDMSHRDYKFL